MSTSYQSIPDDFDQIILTTRPFGSGDGDNKGRPKRLYNWYVAGLIIMGEILGTGIMGLPKATARLGWVLGILSLIMFGLFAIYSGVLLSRTRRDHAPHAKSYRDLGRILVSVKFGKITDWCVSAYWILSTPYYLMAACNAFVLAFYHLNWCYWQWALIIMLILIFPLQLRNYHSLRKAAVISDMFAVIVIGMIIGELIHTGVNPNPLAVTSVGIPPHIPFLTAYDSLSSFIFAFAGQSIFLEIISEMKRPQDFGKSVVVSSLGMFVFYLSIVVVSYYTQGAEVAGFLPGSLANGGLKTIACVLLSFHIMVSYLLASVVICRRLHVKLSPKTADKVNTPGRLWWFGINAGYLLFCYLIANIIPFFSDFQSILGACMAAPIIFWFPPYFFLKGCAKSGVTPSTFDKMTCLFFIWILAPVVTIIGTVAAVKGLIDDWNTFGPPFDCQLIGYE